MKPKNITVETFEKENVHLIIKPVIIVNNTGNGGNDGDNKTKTSDNITIEGAKIKIFDDEGDCDELKISGNYPYNMLKFKEKITSQIDNKPNIQRKFYRKVQIGGEIYAKDIFKQGLNMIFIDRNKKYTKGFIILI